MEPKFHYATLSEAINQLRLQGYTLDFNLKENGIMVNDLAFTPDEFEIVDVYRYEGNSDPADEATVYAIESQTDIKGILVTGYGISDDAVSTDLLKKLNYREGK